MGITDRLSAVAGNVAKATLIFPEIAVEQTTRENAAAQNGNQSMVASLNNLSSALDAVGPTGDVLDLANTLGAAVGGAKTLEVQFNPASLQIDAYGGGRVPISNYSQENGNNAGMVTFGPLAVYINISYTLVFDSTFIADAFAADKFQLNPTALTKNLMSAAVTGVTGAEYTVRPYVEGFLAAMRDPDHRTLIFQWGNMRYVGVMNSIDCRYTMFNPNGEPIRAEVNVNMLSEALPSVTFQPLRDETTGRIKRDPKTNKELRTAVTRQNDNDYLGYWTNRYNAIVNNKDYLSGLTLKNTATSLINL